MKGLAFALDPDGYWIEVVQRTPGVFEEKFNLSQTMLRVKDGPASCKFYTEQLGMKMIRTLHFPQYLISSQCPHHCFLGGSSLSTSWPLSQTRSWLKLGRSTR